MPLPRVKGNLDVLCDACGHRVSSKGLDAHFTTYCPKRAQQPPPTEAEQVRHALDVAEGIRNRR